MRRTLPKNKIPASVRLECAAAFCKNRRVFGNKKRPRERFYLLPGQGGRNYRAKQKLFLTWAAAVAVFFGVGISLVMWWLSRTHH
jgi:uncharacterized MAPEG superfamily protein